VRVRSWLTLEKWVGWVGMMGSVSGWWCWVASVLTPLKEKPVRQVFISIVWSFYALLSNPFL